MFGELPGNCFVFVTHLDRKSQKGLFKKLFFSFVVFFAVGVTSKNAKKT